jgi:hypothetical protein
VLFKISPVAKVITFLVVTLGLRPRDCDFFFSPFFLEIAMALERQLLFTDQKWRHAAGHWGVSSSVALSFLHFLLLMFSFPAFHFSAFSSGLLDDTPLCVSVLSLSHCKWQG